MVEVDRRRVERILRNLLVNAVEHGEGRDVVVTVAADKGAAAVAVRDHGVGLAPGEEQLVFERFWRADPSRARTVGGTGLGLAISLEDARLHGGWLQAWGEKGRGSVFRLTVPRIAGRPIVGSPLPLGPDEAEVITSAVTTLEADLAFPGRRRPLTSGGGVSVARPVTPRPRCWRRWPRSSSRRCPRRGACRCRPAGRCLLPGDPGAGRAEPALRADRAAAAGRRLVAEADRPGVPHRLRQLRRLRPGGPAVPDAPGNRRSGTRTWSASCTASGPNPTGPTYWRPRRRTPTHGDGADHRQQPGEHCRARQLFGAVVLRLAHRILSVLSRASAGPRWAASGGSRRRHRSCCSPATRSRTTTSSVTCTSSIRRSSTSSPTRSTCRCRPGRVT